MTCTDVENTIEALAAGDIAADEAVMRHVESCTRCAAALADARRIERALAGWGHVAAPARFTDAVIARIRRERWRYEEHLDRAFNLTIAVGIVAVFVSVLTLFNLDTAAGALLQAAAAIRNISEGAPAAPRPLVTVLMPSALVALAVAVWWWAERRLPYQEG